MRRHSFLALSGIGTLLVLAMMFALGLQESHPSVIGGDAAAQYASPSIDPHGLLTDRQVTAPAIEMPPLSALEAMPSACPAPKA